MEPPPKLVPPDAGGPRSSPTGRISNAPFAAVRDTEIVADPVLRGLIVYG
jgi:hypothetical protein